jgi:uncharacterized membrane protein
MIETAIIFVAGFMLSWPALITLLVLGILFEHNDAHGWAIFTAMVTTAVAYFFFSVPLMTLAIGAVIYLVVGLIWSFWRYKRHADEVVNAYKDSPAVTKQRVLAMLHPKEMLSTITTWIIIWPFSMVENITSDIITAIQMLVQKVFRNIYHRIYDSAVAQLK